jgi:hypothetical protein
MIKIFLLVLCEWFSVFCPTETARDRGGLPDSRNSGTDSKTRYADIPECNSKFKTIFASFSYLRKKSSVVYHKKEGTK